MNKPVTLENNDKKTYEVRISGQIFTLSPNPVSELEIFRFLHGLNGENGSPKNPEKVQFLTKQRQKSVWRADFGSNFYAESESGVRILKIRFQHG